MLLHILLTLGLGTAHAVAPIAREVCDEHLSEFTNRVLTRLVEGGQLNAPARKHSLVKSVTVRMMTPGVSWNLTSDVIETEAATDGVPGALVTKPSGDVIVVLYPSGNARELLRVGGLEAEIYHAGQMIGRIGGEATSYRAIVPQRTLPKLNLPYGTPETASLYDEPVIAWRKIEGDLQRFTVTDYSGTHIKVQDVVELRTGSRVELDGPRVIARKHRESYLRDHVAVAEPSAWRRLVSQYWRTLRHELAARPLAQMKKARLSSAIINGEDNYDALIGPASQGRCWVIVINSRTRTTIMPYDDNTLSGPSGRAIPLKMAKLEDGRQLRAEFMGWSTEADPGGEPSAAPAAPSSPRSGPTGAVRRARVLELAD